MLWDLEPDLVKWPPLRKHSILSQPLSKIYYLYFLVLLPCTDSTLIQLWQTFYSTSYFECTFRNWVIFSTWALWPRFWPPLGWGAGPTGVLLDQYFSCIHILLKQSFFSEFQVIPAAYIVNQVKFSCLFEPTWHIFFHFLPWMHWVERK